MEEYNTKYPSLAWLKRAAKKRLPKFAFDYVEGGIDDEFGKRRNRQGWNDTLITPRYFRDVKTTDLTTTLFGSQYQMPIGIAPVGLGNMIWPGAEMILANTAAAKKIPYVLSTFSTTTMEAIAAAAGDYAWFQLYVPQQESHLKDFIKRIKSAGFKVLVVTVDIPVGAKRNRELRNGLQLPFNLTAKLVWQAAKCPRWTAKTLIAGAPNFVNVAAYRSRVGQGLGNFISEFNSPGVTTEKFKLIRKLWDKPLVIKGLQATDDVQTAIDIGADGVVISNHGGRQLDAAPSTAASLAAVADKQDKIELLVDCGIRNGLDVVRAGTLGAKMAFCGRGFYWGVGALGDGGGHQVVEIMRTEITRTLQQIGTPVFKNL